MKCEWHNGFKEATWWAATIYTISAWCCDTCLERVGARYETGKFIAIPAAEKLAQLHPDQPAPASCGWDKK